MSNFADLQVNGIEINKDLTTFQTKDAVTKEYVDSKITDLVDMAPAALDTLNELAAALGDDENFATSVTNNFTTTNATVTTEVADRIAGDAAESTARAAADVSLQTNIDAEAATRGAADTTLQTNIDDEAATRGAADTALQTNIDAEAATRDAADTALQTNIDAEAATRGAADTTLQTNIDDEAATRGAADTALQTNIDAEAATRGAADTTLQTNIDDEAATRGAADTALQVNIDAEATTRAAADAALQTNIDTSYNSLNTAKLDKSDEYCKRDDDHFQIKEMSYLYIGDAWRIAANNMGGQQKLQFEYSEDSGVTWAIGIPFIRGTV